MAINPEDVKLYESQRLSDETDGGGRATGNEVVDGTINNLFKDISRLDRTLGDVALRKAFVGVATNNQDTYLGAHAIIVDPPADSNVNVLIFDAGSESDERLDAQQRIESYVVRGGKAQLDLLGNQYEGQRQIVCIQREEQPIPEVGEVYLLDNPDNSDLQYIRITEIDESIQNFTITLNGSLVEFSRRRLDMGISAPLDYTFPGSDAHPSGPQGDYAEVFSTEVADAARYWGVKRSVGDIVQGDVQIKVDSIYSSLVPSAQAESPLLDQSMGPDRKDVRPASSSAYTHSVTALYLDGVTIRLVIQRPAVLGSLQLTLGGSSYVDDGSGTLTRSSGGNPFSTLTIDYTTGEIVGKRDSGTSSGTISGTATFTPGGKFSGKAVSLAVPVELANRGYNWIQSFADAKPRPGTTVVSYMALGKWYDIKDPGNGVMSGVGIGTVNFITGTISVTLEALPDVDSDILFSYIIDDAEDVTEHSGALATAAGEIPIELEKGIAPGSVVVTYTSGAVNYTLTDGATMAVLAGDGSGSVDYAAGTLKFKPDTIPDDGTTITVDYDYAATSQEVITSPSFSNGVISGTIPNAPLEPGSIELGGIVRYLNSYNVGISRWHTMKDDGAGGWLYGQNSSLNNTAGVGTINYATGAYSVELLHEWLYIRRSYNYTRTYNGGESSYSSTRTSEYSPVRETLTGSVFIDYQSASPSVSGNQVVTPVESVEIRLLDAEGSDPFIPGSVLFTWGGKTYFDRDGIIYTDFDSQTGGGTSVGSIDYNEKLVSLYSWPEGATPGVDLKAAISVSPASAVNMVAFRTPGAPIRPGSTSITITDLDGNIISEQAGIDGVISGPNVEGTINVETGVIELNFTDGVDPVFVFQDSGRYNAVYYTFLPLDAELIGLNPVRLPSDGRVPIYREGDVVVLSHTDETSEPTPVAGEQIQLPRTYLAGVEIFGANGFVLDTAQYTVNKLTGVVTLADPLTLEDAASNVLTTPLSIKHRVEHMSVINDVQITGELSFISPTGHDFPADETVVSSALVWGDIQSRYYNFYTQKTWYGDYLDDRVGDDTTANYNDIDNPIEIANNGAITEKWVIKFTSSTAFQIIGENLGVIGTGSTSVDVSPTNPNTGNPYFIMRSAGFGGGWATGNCIRFDTDGCLAPVWLARTVLSGAAEQDDDKFIFQIRGDAD